MLTDLEISLDEYRRLYDTREKAPLKDELWNQTYNTMFNRSVFFLHKGPRQRDSRSHIGLAHTLHTDLSKRVLEADEPLRLSVHATNTGEALWLDQNTEIFGTVRLGSHLYSGDGTLLSIDFSRHALPRPVKPSETIEIPVEIRLPGSGAFRLAFDMVAEGVTWFETTGSKPVVIEVEVRAG